ncbi:integrator complex subunit 14-like [Daphnia pulex]|uniref:integrator complex subunit 14-like n=1 Tax=Daphnia pulex TaxID=6669 RepID=UPI001EDE4B17|nr:integrator complex subunit 14-like [Daphnia pulex]
MPLAIVLDVSLSMSRVVSTPEEEEEYQRKHLAIHGINVLLDHLNTHSKLEFVSLVVFSSMYEILSSFTRDYDAVRAKLQNIEDRDKTYLEAALHGVSILINDEWGQNTPCHVLLITDGSSSLNILGLSRTLLNGQRGSTRPEEALPFLPFNFPAKFHVIAITSPDDPALAVSMPVYQKIIDLSGAEGSVFVPEGGLSLKSVQNMFTKIAELHYSSFEGTLRSGSLSDSILLYPPPRDHHHIGDMEVIHCKISKDITICGFVDLIDVASPPAVSRHLVLPVHSANKSDASLVELKAEGEGEDDLLATPEEGKNPSFCVLLHGALKVENMGAICNVGEKWYGLLYSWADSKKKSNLMLSIFEPGTKCIPWLGDLSLLGSFSEATSPGSFTTFPIKPNEKRSYAQSCVVWVQPGNLQADIQKILRHARKMPDKTQHFYKELNRLKRAALSMGFADLLETMAVILDRECTLLPHTAHPDCAMQLTHASAQLRLSRDVRHNITALRTKFTHDD